MALVQGSDFNLRDLHIKVKEILLKYYTNEQDTEEM